jgi:aspartyl-tRNA(Asn)/glutamyl-tRNA(Gln) amidotransferase subunit B
LTRIANDREVDLTDLPVTPAQIKRVEALVAEGSLNDKLARQVFDGIVNGEGDVDDVVAGRGLGIVSDDSALIAAIDAALAEQPDVAEKIRGGKVQAAGAIVGAVMKSTRGQADAAKVRSLLLERLGRSQYVGYTATPFANVFVDPDDSVNIFPNDFIVSPARSDAAS